MRKSVTTLLFVFLLLGSINLNAQKQWSLQECINYALQNNIQIKRQELQTQIAKNNYRQSKFERLPDLGAQWSHQYNSGRSLNMEQYTWENRNLQQGSLGISSNVTIFEGMQITNSIQYYRLNLEKSLADLEKAKSDISLNIALAYLDILFNDDLLQVAKSQLEISNQQVEKNLKLMEVGSIAKGNLLETQAQAAREQVNVTTVQNSLNLSYLNLTQLLDLDSIGDFRILKPDSLAVEEKAVLESVNDIYAASITKRPEIKSSELNLVVQQKNLAISKGRLYPTLSLNGSYYSRYNETAQDLLSSNPDNYPYSSQIKDNQYKQLSLNLSVPIFNKLSTRKNINNSKISVKDAEYTLSQTQQALYKEIQQAHADALAAYDKYMSSNKAVSFSEEAFKYAQQKLDVGMISIVDYNLSKNNLTKAKSDLIQAKYEYIFKIKVLDFYKGLPIIL